MLLRLFLTLSFSFWRFHLMSTIIALSPCYGNRFYEPVVVSVQQTRFFPFGTVVPYGIMGA
jgi:hypothetical protein